MKIILTSKQKNLGEIGDIVVVKDGYARNFLLPNGFALYYSEANYKVFEEQKKEIQEQNKKAIELATTLQKKIKGKDTIVIENAGDDGKLYGSVSSIRLSKMINELSGSNLKKSNVVLKDSIKNIGKYKITLNLHPEVSFEKEIIVARTNEEAGKIKSGEWEKEQKRKAEAEKKEQAKLEAEAKKTAEKAKAKEEEKVEAKEEKVEEKEEVKEEVKKEEKDK